MAISRSNVITGALLAATVGIPFPFLSIVPRSPAKRHSFSSRYPPLIHPFPLYPRSHLVFNLTYNPIIMSARSSKAMATGGKAAQPLPIIFRPEPEAADDATLMRLNIVYRLSTKGAVNEGAIDVASQAPMQHLLNGWAIGVNVDSNKFSFGMKREKKFKLTRSLREKDEKHEPFGGTGPT